MPLTRAEWETFFKDNGKMSLTMVWEWNKTFEEQRAMQSTKWPAQNLIGQPKDFKDAKTAAEANERQGLNTTCATFTSVQKTISKANYFCVTRELDPYSILFHQRINTDLTGDDWLGLDVVRRRFQDDNEMIQELLIVIQILSDDCTKLKRKLDAKRNRGNR